MDLMKELLTAKVEETTEYSGAKNARFQKILSIVAKELDHLHVLTKEGGGFSKLIQELGADPGIIIDARQALHKLDDAFSDIEMSVGMAQDPHRDDMGNL